MAGSPVRARHGFTIVEMVVTLVIVGVLASTALPRFIRIQDFQARFFYDEALTSLRYAQKLAIATGCPVQVDFNAGGYAVTQRVSCTTGAYTQLVHDPADGTPGLNGTAPSGVAFTSNVDPIVFDMLGRALDGGGTESDVTVSVGARSIAVVGATGFVDGG